MKKLFILFIMIFTIVGCSIENSAQHDDQILEKKLIGDWEYAIPIENGHWYISGIIFYGNNKCSLHSNITTSYGYRTLVDDICKYEIDGNDICIGDSVIYTYIEQDNSIIMADDPRIAYKKIGDDPCITIFSHCD